MGGAVGFGSSEIPYARLRFAGFWLTALSCLCAPETQLCADAASARLIELRLAAAREDGSTAEFVTVCAEEDEDADDVEAAFEPSALSDVDMDEPDPKRRRFLGPEVRQGLEAAAAKGSSAAMVVLGMAYESGTGGVAKEEKKAYSLFSKAADAGEPLGMVAAAMALWDGRGVQPDSLAAARSFQRVVHTVTDGDIEGQSGCDSGNNSVRAAAAVNLVALTSQRTSLPDMDPAVVSDVLHVAGIVGDTAGIVNLGVVSLGAGDETAAFERFKEAALKGDVDGMFRLGVCYAEGIGVGKDARKAVYWLDKAASGGHLQAKVRLGAAYADGPASGVQQQDAKRAFALFAEAAAGGDPDGMYNVALELEQGGVTVDVATAAGVGVQGGVQCSATQLARAWYRKAAEAEPGSCWAMRRLAAAFEDGSLGDECDEELAKFWLDEARDAGYVSEDDGSEAGSVEDEQ
jgi:TPR repeat protein